MEDIERELKKDVIKHMGRLSSQMKLFKDMRGAYAYRRSEELYKELTKVLIKLNQGAK